MARRKNKGMDRKILRGIDPADAGRRYLPARLVKQAGEVEPLPDGQKGPRRECRGENGSTRDSRLAVAAVRQQIAGAVTGRNRGGGVADPVYQYLESVAEGEIDQRKYFSFTNR
jgi:hypothetical protein